MRRTLSFVSFALVAAALVAAAVHFSSRLDRLTVTVERFQPPDLIALPEEYAWRDTVGLRPALPIDDHVFRKVNREALRNGPGWIVERDFGAWRMLAI